MRKEFMRAALSLSGLMFIIIVFGSIVIVAQETITGTWTADTRTGKQDKEDPKKIQLSFERRTDRGRNQNGSSFLYSELQGLTREQAVQDGRVSFRLVREAGTIDCEGSFVSGRGSGTFKFTPDMSFVTAMRARGFDFEKSSGKRSDDTVSERLMTAAFINVTTALADDLNSANFGKLEVDDLYKAAIFKIDGKFMAEMKATGFPNLGMEDLVKARIFKIDAEFVRKTREMGFGTDNFENLVKFSIFKVTPEFLTELRNEGLTDLSSEDVVKLRIFKIDAAYVREARSTEPNITVEQLVQKRIGVRR